MFKKFIAAAFIAAVSSSAFAQACPVKDTRVCDVLVKANEYKPQRQIVWREWSTSHPSVAAEYEWALGPADVVHLGNTRDLNDDAVFFLVAHELGHSMHGHSRKYLELFAPESERNLPDAELVKKYVKSINEFNGAANALNKAHELEADQFAIELMLRNGMDPVKAIKALLKNKASSAHYPTRNERIARAEQLTQAYQAIKVAAVQ